MENLCFVLWMLLYPIATCIARYIGVAIYHDADTHSDSLRILVSMLELIIWIAVGSMLYKP